MDEVTTKLNSVVEGHSDPTVKLEIQQKLQKQVSGLFSDQ